MKNKLTNQSAPARQPARESFRSSLGEGGFFRPRVLLSLLVCLAAGCFVASDGLLAFFRTDAPSNHPERTITFAERVAYQRAIEEVYWRHRIWPKERPDPKPSLDAVMSQAQLESKVQDYLRKSQALEDYSQQPITPGQLQAEMGRMVKNTKQPEVLRELFEALGNDPFVIAECLARPTLAEGLLREINTNKRQVHRPAQGSSQELHGRKEPLESGRATSQKQMTKPVAAAGSYRLPDITSNSGGRYNPQTDSWLPTNGALTRRASHTPTTYGCG